MIGNKWDFCLMTYKIHSCVFQSQFRSSFCLARNWLGVDPSVTLVCSKWDLLDMWFLPMGVVSPWLDRQMCTLGLTFPHSFIFSELPEKPPNLPHLKTCWVRSVFHWYDYLAAIFIPSLGTTDFMLRVDALSLLIRLYKIFKIRPLMVNKCKLEGWFYKTD